MWWCVPFLAMIMIGFSTTYAYAQQMHAGDACLFYTGHYERTHTIPSQLLYAIALTESGRMASGQKGRGVLKPWPWTINVEGKPYIFETKEEAVQAVKRFKSKGVRSIDIGCMQVNLHHHPHAFASIEQAFDPGYNVRYAAKFLLENYQREGNWHQAIGAYHSLTNHLGRDYTRRVMHMWKTHASLNGKVPNTSNMPRHTKMTRMGKSHSKNSKKSAERLRSNMMVMVRNEESMANNAPGDQAIGEMSNRLLASHPEE